MNGTVMKVFTCVQSLGQLGAKLQARVASATTHAVPWERSWSGQRPRSGSPSIPLRLCTLGKCETSRNRLVNRAPSTFLIFMHSSGRGTAAIGRASSDNVASRTRFKKRRIWASTAGVGHLWWRMAPYSLVSGHGSDVLVHHAFHPKFGRSKGLDG